MQRIEIREKKTSTAIFQFIFPFSVKAETETEMISFLKNQGFERFRLDHMESEKKYYGDFHVSHRNMEAYYLPFTNKILFPHTESQKGFQRYSKAVNLVGQLRTKKVTIPFKIHSIDIIVGPYQLGFLTIRTEVAKTEDIPLSYAIEFAARFRVLEPRTTRDHETVIDFEGNHYNQVENFIFEKLYPGLPDFFERESIKGAYFETFPFFEDERMYVQSLICLNENEKVDKVDVYRSADLNGLDKEGQPFVTSNNLAYIQRYLKLNGYDRWAPTTYYLMDEHSFACVTNEADVLTELASQIYGEFYYGLVLNLFHKIVLLKMANDYSEIEIERDTEKIEELIHSINSFTANFFFLELATQSQGRDIFVHLRKVFQIDALYEDARQTLNSLYRYQEQISSKQNSVLLLILTLYTVVSGIFGMNQVIDDLKENIKWGRMMHYSFFEYIALVTTFSGLLITAYLGIHNLIKWKRDRRKRKQWTAQTVLDTNKK